MKQYNMNKNLTTQDLKEIAIFFGIIKAYNKMNRLLNE